MFKWLAQGRRGWRCTKSISKEAELLYGVIDNSDFYRNDVAQANRSRMSVPFQLAGQCAGQDLSGESFAAGLHALRAPCCWRYARLSITPCQLEG
ncbi:hypothetical protein KCP75_04045 [Salmonella enterica subsp. enterica]|nr:hypothetical protein KCP75_04045 [Salmonella enterica subsp. enterica]